MTMPPTEPDAAEAARQQAATDARVIFVSDRADVVTVFDAERAATTDEPTVLMMGANTCPSCGKAYGDHATPVRLPDLTCTEPVMLDGRTLLVGDAARTYRAALIGRNAGRHVGGHDVLEPPPDLADVLTSLVDRIDAEPSGHVVIGPDLAVSDWPEVLSDDHFHGCPDAEIGNSAFDCDWCQDRARGMSE